MLTTVQRVIERGVIRATAIAIGCRNAVVAYHLLTKLVVLDGDADQGHDQDDDHADEHDLGRGGRVGDHGGLRGGGLGAVAAAAGDGGGLCGVGVVGGGCGGVGVEFGGVLLGESWGLGDGDLVDVDVVVGAFLGVEAEGLRA